MALRYAAMDAPNSLDSAPIQPLSTRVWRAIGQLEMSSKWALFCIFMGWFFVDTLVVSLGSLQHGVRFFDLSAVIGDPTRMFFGIEISAQRILFSGICAVCLLAPLLPHLRGNRTDWFAYFAPLFLIVLCGALLYRKSSAEFFATPSDAGAVSGNFIRFANGLARRGSGLVAKHISVGVGGYLALIGSVVLAGNGVRNLRRAGHEPVPPPRLT